MKKGAGHIRKLLYLLRVIPACSTTRRLNHIGCYLNRCSTVRVNFTEKTNILLLIIPGHIDQNFIKIYNIIESLKLQLRESGQISKMFLSKHKAGNSEHPLHRDRTCRLKAIEIVRGIMKAPFQWVQPCKFCHSLSLKYKSHSTLRAL